MSKVKKIVEIESRVAAFWGLGAFGGDCGRGEWLIWRTEIKNL